MTDKSKLQITKRYFEAMLEVLEDQQDDEHDKGRLRAYKDALAYVTGMIKWT